MIYELPNGRRAEINDLTFGRARLCLVSKFSCYVYENEW
jgi:hypothetical protein